MSKLIEYGSPEKEILLELFKKMPLMDNWIATLIESYIYSTTNKECKCVYKEYLLRFNKIHGEYREYFKDGKLYKKSIYDNGKLHGEYLEWKHSKKTSWLTKKHLYVMGNLQERKEYYNNGKLMVQASYKNNKLHGEYTYWYLSSISDVSEKENKCEQMNYVDGKLHGEYLNWNENGQLIAQKNYLNGKLHGEYKRWFIVRDESSHRRCFEQSEKTSKILFKSRVKEPGLK